MSIKTKYGIAPYSGIDPVFGPEIGLKASQTFYVKSGRYLTYDTGDTAFKSTANAEAAISAYTDWTGTGSSTLLATKISMAFNVDQFATELPYAVSAASTLTAAVLVTIYSKLIDLYVSTYQYADNNASIQDSLFRVVGGDVAENTLYVTVVASKMNQES